MPCGERASYPLPLFSVKAPRFFDAWRNQSGRVRGGPPDHTKFFSAYNSNANGM